VARIGIAGFLHETNTFAASRASFATFVEADAWPGLLVGEEIFGAVSGVNLAIDGFIQAARPSHQLVPLLWASANPSGPVTQDAFEAIAFMLDRMIRDAGPLDALFLDLHGAMVSEHLEDGEGELLQRLRQRVGGTMPIVAALDFHANITPAMIEHASGLVTYRSYPHVDMAQTGQRAQVLIDRLLAGEVLHKGYRQIPFLIPMPWQSTLTEPMRGLVALGESLASEHVFAADFVPGFPLADIHHSGPSVIAYGCDRMAVEAAVDSLTQAVLTSRADFGGRLYAPADAVAHALEWGLRPIPRIIRAGAGAAIQPISCANCSDKKHSEFAPVCCAMPDSSKRPRTRVLVLLSMCRWAELAGWGRGRCKHRLRCLRLERVVSPAQGRSTLVATWIWGRWSGCDAAAHSALRSWYRAVNSKLPIRPCFAMSAPILPITASSFSRAQCISGPTLPRWRTTFWWWPRPVSMSRICASCVMKN